MKKASFVFCLLLFYIGTAHASDLDTAKKMIESGQLEDGAKKLVSFIASNPNDVRETPYALLTLGKVLDRLQDVESGRAEKECYWTGGAKANPACMQKEADKLNNIYGEGAFKFVTDIAYIPYAGTHYKTLMDKFPKSREANEAEFWYLLKNLVGHPDIVLPKIKNYLNEHKTGEAKRRGLLLWARVNEDVWYIHREWSWVLYNEKVAPEELIIRAEPYRQEALRTFQELIKKYSNTFEGKTAKEEYDKLAANKDDGEIYSILSDTIGVMPDKWGSDIPKPALNTMRTKGK